MVCRWNLTGRSQKLGGFEDAVRISSDGNGGRVGVVPVPEAEVGVPQYQLAPYVPRTITAARSNSDPRPPKGKLRRDGTTPVLQTYGPSVS